MADNSRPGRRAPAGEVFIVVTARDEGERIAATLAALADAFPRAAVLVADDGSADATAEIAGACGAKVLSSRRSVGKGGAATLAAREALRRADGAPAGSGEQQQEAIVLLCDGDLGQTAAALVPLVQAVREGEADIAVAAFSRRLGGGVGLAIAVARWAIRRRCRAESRAPLSGQRALRAGALEDVLPFADGFGMEVGMTIDAVRAGHLVVEIELDLAHRVSGRTLGGFAHRGRQLLDVLRAYRARR